MLTVPVTSNDPLIRVMGRVDPDLRPLALDWTGTGVEVRFKGSALWAELEAPAASPVMWMIVLCDGHPVCRFPVEQGRRFYPLVLGMEAEKERLVTLMKETQPMPSDPDATVFIHALRAEGEFLPLTSRKYFIEFLGDSLTSGEGALAPAGNDEWITLWFTAWGNYPYTACRELDADFQILSQSGYGVCWDWQHDAGNNMADGYELTAGVLSGPSAEARGCRKPWGFARQPDIVCIRLTTNDQNGMNMKDSFAEDRKTVILGAKALIEKVRKHNPEAKIVWILPSTDCHPELAAEAAERCVAEGMDRLYTFTLPDYGPDDMGARFHPCARWNRNAGHLLAEYLKTLLADQ